MPAPKIIDTGPVPHLPRPPRAGDVWLLTKRIYTAGAFSYEPGTQFHLVKKTDEAPFGFKCPEGNWWVRIKDEASVWSSIPYMISDGSLVLETIEPISEPLSRFDRHDPI